MRVAGEPLSKEATEDAGEVGALGSGTLAGDGDDGLVLAEAHHGGVAGWGDLLIH